MIGMFRSEELAAKALERMDDDRYLLLATIFQRIGELTRGAKPLVDMDIRKDKAADIALKEIADGKISIDSIQRLEQF